LEKDTMKRLIAALLFLVLGSLGFSQATQGKTVQERLGYPASARLLIIHADDVGMAHSVNRASFEALENHWITSASILVPCPWFPEVAQWANKHPDADLGIHLALNSEWTPFRWGPVAGRGTVPSLLAPDGYMPLLETDVPGHAKPEEVLTELRAQIEMARHAGIPLSHFDSHMGALFQSEPLMRQYLEVGKEYKMPELMDRSERSGPPSIAPPERVLIDQTLGIAPGVSAAQWVDEYKKLLQPLPPGVYQLIVHLAYDNDEMQGATWDHPNWGAAWRQHDFDMVKSADFQNWLKQQGFILIGWKQLGKALPADAFSKP
jgi:predicted glycoside hydrolase/deacetylase ChbG (UPF0249 family)